MKIDSDVCIAGEACFPYCPMEAISVKDDVTIIDQEECVSCGVCLSLIFPGEQNGAGLTWG